DRRAAPPRERGQKREVPHSSQRFRRERVSRWQFGQVQVDLSVVVTVFICSPSRIRIALDGRRPG
ncbi:MAG TPA: hypothetical protein VHF92_16660, partial [Geodermatophilus sp.]|nr:hypothetical protein [Geodermatophilus sp.]